MATQPENRRIQAVNKKLPTGVHREKMHNPYRGGTPDMWYSGYRGDMWIEWKWIPAIPKREDTVILPDLSKLQLLWLTGREKEGRNVFVVVACPEGNVVYGSHHWTNGMSVSEFKEHLMSLQETVDWIRSEVG